MAHIYEVGTRAWQPDPTEGWVPSEVKEKLVDGEKVQLVFELENGEVGSIALFTSDLKILVKRKLKLTVTEESRLRLWRRRNRSYKSIITPSFRR